MKKPRRVTGADGSGADCAVFRQLHTVQSVSTTFTGIAWHVCSCKHHPRVLIRFQKLDFWSSAKPVRMRTNGTVPPADQLSQSLRHGFSQKGRRPKPTLLAPKLGLAPADKTLARLTLVEDRTRF